MILLIKPFAKRIDFSKRLKQHEYCSQNNKVICKVFNKFL